MCKTVPTFEQDGGRGEGVSGHTPPLSVHIEEGKGITTRANGNVYLRKKSIF